MIVAGVLGLKNMADGSKAQLLMGLGIGLAVAQVGWVSLSSYWNNKVLYILGFLAVTALYILSAMNLNKGTSMSLGQAGMGGQSYIPGQPNIATQPYVQGEPNVAAGRTPSLSRTQPSRIECTTRPAGGSRSWVSSSPSSD